ncbi:hypothetical protein ACHHYP_09035 [Achlya hypogyna]|uniref:Uncharacterized protein n=1 Tax=Achlya hypogyna TaxID=1202772 RepID=A0A1V9ZJK4_ACHHY|nr:hypothetical protein ACHHYP_09035 [Achlya hypogyna]
MLRTVSSLLSNGGFQRVISVRERVANRYSGQVVDGLLGDGIIAPRSIGDALNIVFSSCAPTSNVDVDLREFAEGARHAVHTSMLHMFSKAVVQCQVDRTAPADDVNNFLMAACAPPLYEKLLNKSAHSSAPTQFAVPQRVKSCAILSADYAHDDDDEVLKFSVMSDVVCVMKPLAEPEPATTALPDTVVEVAVKATFRSRIVPDGSLDWILENIRMTKV